MPGLIITASPGLTVVTSVPAVYTTTAPSDPRMWGNRYSPGRPRTTNRSRWLSAAARMATRTSRAPSRAGEPGAATSAISMRSRPPVERMTQARIVPRSSDTVTGASRAGFASDSGCFTRRFAAGAGRGAKCVPLRGGDRGERRTQLRRARRPVSIRVVRALLSRALQFFSERRERAGIDDVAGLQPGAPRQVHGVLHERQVPGLVAIGREHEAGAELLGGRGERVGQVHALGVPIELERAPMGHAGAYHGVEVEAVGLALAEHASGGMADRVHPGVLGRIHQSPRQLFLGLGEAVVDGRHDVVRFGEHVVGKIELAVLEDVELDALQDREAATRRVPLVDRPPLLAEPFGVEPQRHRDPLRVIGDRDVLVAERAGGLGHLVDGALAVGGRGVHLEIAADVRELHEARQSTLAGQGDFPAGFAQLRRYPVEAELGVDLFLGLPGHAPRPLEQAVLVELVAVLLGDLAELDVVRFGAGEVLQRRAVRGGLDRAQVHLQPAAQLDRGSGVAFRDHVRHVAVGDEAVHDAGAVVRRDEDVEIADRLAAAPVAAGDRDLTHATAGLEIRDERGRLGFRLVQEHAPLGHLGLAETGAHLLLYLGPEALELLDLALVERLREVAGGFHFQLLVEQLHALGAEPGNPQQVEQARRELGGELFAKRQLALGDNLRDLLRQVVAYACDVGQVFGAGSDQVRERLREVADGTGGVAVRPHPERVGVLDLEEVGHLVEQAGDVGVLHGGNGRKWTAKGGSGQYACCRLLPPLPPFVSSANSPPPL